MAKSSSSNYQILVGVQLDTSNIQKQLNEAAKNLRFDMKFDSQGAKTLTGEIQTITKSSKEMGDSAKEATDKVKGLGKGAKDASDNMADAYLTFQAANEVFQTSIDIISAMVEQVFELDNALVEFKKVSDLTGESLENYVEQLGEMGAEVARTTSEMVQSATEFKKSGFSDEDSAMLGQLAAMYQNVADEAMSAGEAASFIIAQMAAFNIEANDATKIVDSVNAVSNAFAVSSSDLAQSLGNASSALAIGNNSLEETLALLTAGTEIVRNASKVSRGNKSLSV